MKSIFVFWISVVFLTLTACEKELKEYNEPTGVISGIVVDKTTGKALKDVFVVFEKMQNGALHGTMSKADGSFSFNALSTGDYKIYGIQDTMKMGGDTLQIYVNDGQHAKLKDKLEMQVAGVPYPEIPQVIAVTHNSITLRVAYDNRGSMVAGRGFFYTSDGSIPTIKSSRKGASNYDDIINGQYYEVTITGLRATTSYCFKSYLYVKNWTPLVFNNNYVVLSDGEIRVTTKAIPQ